MYSPHTALWFNQLTQVNFEGKICDPNLNESQHQQIKTQDSTSLFHPN